MYAFLAPPTALPDVRGIDSAPLEVEAAAGVDAVVSRHDAAVEASEAAILAHARVVEALAASNEAVLPARFGSAHGDGASLHDALAERARELQAALVRVRGCVELGVRALAPVRATADASSGAAYMRARLEQRRDVERLADVVHGPLAALAREATRTVGATPRLLLSAAYLVPSEDVEAFREAVAKVEAEHGELGIVCTGPWPPYSFATAEGGAP